ncbi:hypothetical protein A0U93_07625 [Neoasaia chiangmaiensis]|uniref:Uncharacterized protein n=2 Tax=Neoasaia chiangmaiensis TaxID=320497 RepID=A0A1U9KU88_9PROT|nr:hypothetical protein A0U93_07625 [Neoasaia chiangmaiensis]
MVGMTSYDLQACAGIPASVKQLNDTTQIYQYTGTHTLPTFSGSTLIPVADISSVIQEFSGGGGTTCTAVIRLDHDRVSEVHYTGDDDEVIGTDGICSIITRGCARQPEATERKVNAGPFGPVSAFAPAKTPNQNTDATYSKQSGGVITNPDPKSTKPVILPRTQ